MTQTSGSMPALYDGVGTKKKPKAKKRIAVAGVKGKLDRLFTRVKR